MSKIIEVAAILHNAGFSTVVQDNEVRCWLNRPIGKLEIEMLLAQEFEDVQFSIQMKGKFALINPEG